MQTTISIDNGKIVIHGPYSEKNNATWRSLGGKFSGGNWVLPDNDSCRQTVAELFGTKSDEIEALVPAPKVSDGQIIQIGGYVLAQRRHRDWQVQMPDGVQLQQGQFAAHGGSIKNPRVNIDNDMIFRLRCRRSFAESNELEIVTDCPKLVNIEI